jgi:citrate synthase
VSNFAESEAITSISTANRERITVRGRDFCDEIVGRFSLTAFLYFHVTGREPTVAETQMLDALLVSITEHGLSPTAIAARLTYASAPEALQAAIAAGLLGAGTVVLGAAQEVAEVLADGVNRVKRGGDAAAIARELASQTRERGAKLPGFGHPLHHPVDPRAQRLIAIAEQLNLSGPHLEFLQVLTQEARSVWQKPLVLNVQGPIAAIALDMGLPAFLMRAIPIIARAVGVLGHIAEEREHPLAFHLTMLANHATTYVDPITLERSRVIED